MEEEKINVDLCKCKNLEMLSRFLNIDKHLLEAKINLDNPNDSVVYTNKSSTMSSFYKMEIPKKNSHRNSEKRVIWQIINIKYKEAYKRFNRLFNNFIKQKIQNWPNNNAYGFIKGKNILENAKQHCNKKYILHTDICNFFNSITLDMIKTIFIKKLELKENVAQILAKFITIDNKLPLGFNCSPMISNLVCIDLDIDLFNLAQKYNCIYTRYADDITISGNENLPQIDEINKILLKYNFLISKNKTRITKYGWHHFVTGLSVETENPRIPRKIKKRLRQELYYCKKFGAEEHFKKINNCDLQTNINRIDGMIRYVSYFEKEFNKNYDTLWEEIKKKEKIYPNFYKYINKDKKIIIFIDESEIEYKNSNFLEIALVSVLEDDLENIKKDLISIIYDFQSPNEGGKYKNRLEEGILHFNESNEDLKRDYLNKILNKYCIKSYIGYKELKNKNDIEEYRNIYAYILKKLITFRFLNLESEIVGIVIEENSKISKQYVGTIFQNRNINNILKFEDKKYNLLSLPDFVLGFFNNYIKSKNGNKDDREKYQRYENFFEAIRDKYKIINGYYDDGNKLFFRKRPFKGEL